MTGALGLGATVGVPSVSAQTSGGDLLWTFETDDQVSSSPTVVGGTVFVGGRDGNVYALDASSGDERWAFEIGDEVWSSPTVVGGTVFVGSNDGSVYALDAGSGDERWAFEPGDQDFSSPVFSSPTVADGTVFVGSWDTNVYALDASSGEQQWAFETGARVISSPTVADGTVFVGSEDSNVYALDASSGDERWAFQTGGRPNSSPAVADGTVFVGSWEFNVYALDASSGDERWAFQTGDWILSSPTVADGIVFVGSADDNVYALEASSGDRRWAFQTSDAVFSSPTVAEGTVFVGSIDNHVYALDASSGDRRWAFETGDQVFSSPTVVDGTVFVGSGDTNVYALDAGVAGSSRGSRVLSRTLGHHDIPKAEERSLSTIRSPTTPSSFPYRRTQELVFDGLGSDGAGIAGEGVSVYVTRERVSETEGELTVGVGSSPDSFIQHILAHGGSQLLLLHDADRVSLGPDPVESRIDFGARTAVVTFSNLEAGSIPEQLDETVTKLARAVDDEWVSTSSSFALPPALEDTEEIGMAAIDFSTPTTPHPGIIDHYELTLPVTAEEATESVISVMFDVRARTRPLQTPSRTLATPANIEYRAQVDVPLGELVESNEADEDDADSLPGFGVGGALAGIGAGYLLERRLRGDDE